MMDGGDIYCCSPSENFDPSLGGSKVATPIGTAAPHHRESLLGSMASRWNSTVAVVLLSLYTVVCSSVLADFKPETGSALATWSGAADGAGSEAGECGYFRAVKEAPWGSNVTAVSPSMFRGGAACGTCWELKATDLESRYEEEDPVIRVVVTDVCRGGPCAAADKHFELSGHAFGALANRSRGHIVVTYTRVDCDYGGTRSAYRVDGSATTENFLLTPLYIPGYETISVSLVHSRYDHDGALLMTRVRGAVFLTNATSLRSPPYTVSVLYNDTTKFAGYQETLSLEDGIIPPGWEPGHTYVAPRDGTDQSRGTDLRGHCSATA